MGHSLTYHLGECPRYLRPALTEGAVARRLREQIGEVVQEAEAMPDHPHLVIERDLGWLVASLAARLRGREFLPRGCRARSPGRRVGARGRTSPSRARRRPSGLSRPSSPPSATATAPASRRDRAPHSAAPRSTGELTPGLRAGRLPSAGSTSNSAPKSGPRRRPRPPSLGTRTGTLGPTVEDSPRALAGEAASPVGRIVTGTDILTSIAPTDDGEGSAAIPKRTDAGTTDGWLR
jgi:hypothetical protein